MKRQDELNEAWCKYRGKCSTEIIHALAFALKWFDEHPAWISVEDELPERNKWVLTFNGSSINLLMLASNGNWYDHSVAQHRNVTHWMALPSPPEHFADVSKKISGSSGIPNNHTKTIKKGGEQ